MNFAALQAAVARAQAKADLAFTRQATVATAAATATAAVATAVTSLGLVAENEVPPEPCNNARTDFTLAHAPIAGSVKLYVSGVRTLAFTVVGNLLTVTIAPRATDNLIVDYRWST